MLKNNSKIFFAALVAIEIACMGACSTDDTVPKASNPPSEPIPPYKQIIQDILLASKSTLSPLERSKLQKSPPSNWLIKNVETYAPFEISGAQQVFSLKGWAWLVCLKGNNGDRPIYFGVFIQGNSIVSIRVNVGVDLCPHQLYEPLPFAHIIDKTSHS